MKPYTLPRLYMQRYNSLSTKEKNAMQKDYICMNNQEWCAKYWLSEYIAKRLFWKKGDQKPSEHFRWLYETNQEKYDNDLKTMTIKDFIKKHRISTVTLYNTIGRKKIRFLRWKAYDYWIIPIEKKSEHPIPSYWQATPEREFYFLPKSTI